MALGLKEALEIALKRREEELKKKEVKALEKKYEYYEAGIIFLNKFLTEEIDGILVMIPYQHFYWHLIGSMPIKIVDKVFNVQRFSAGGYVFIADSSIEKILQWKDDKKIETVLIEEKATKCPQLVERRYLQLDRIR
jgi:hypothetical protein